MSHYSFGQKPFRLMPWSQKMAKEIHTTFKDGGVMPVLLYSGMSGIALSTAVANSFYSMYGENLYMTYIRKEGERSHGSPVEWEYLYCIDILHEDYVSFFCLPDKSRTGKIPICLIFVDDFVSSGETLMRCINKFRGAIANRGDVIFRTKKVLFCSGIKEVLTDYSEIEMMESKKPILRLLESGRDADEEKFVQENMPPATPVEEIQMNDFGPRGNLDGMKQVAISDAEFAKKINDIYQMMFPVKPLKYIDLTLQNIREEAL